MGGAGWGRLAAERVREVRWALASLLEPRLRASKTEWHRLPFGLCPSLPKPPVFIAFIAFITFIAFFALVDFRKFVVPVRRGPPPRAPPGAFIAAIAKGREGAGEGAD